MKSKSTTGLSKFLIISFTIYIMYELYVYNKQLEKQREEQERQRKEKQKEEEKKNNIRKKKIIILFLGITYFFVLFFTITLMNKNYDPIYFITGNEKVYYLKNFKVTEITTKELLLKEREANMKGNRNFIYIIIRKDNKIFTGYVARRFFRNPNQNNVIKIPLITPNFYKKEKKEFLLLNRKQFEETIKTNWNYRYRANVFRVKSGKYGKIYDIDYSYYYNPTGYHATA